MAYEEARALLASAYQDLEWLREECEQDKSEACRLALRRAREEYLAAREEFNRAKVAHNYHLAVRHGDSFTD